MKHFARKPQIRFGRKNFWISFVRMLCNPHLLRISVGLLLFRKAQGKCHFEGENPYDRFSSLLLGCICMFQVFMLVFCILSFCICNFSNSSLRKALGKCHFERESPYERFSSLFLDCIFIIVLWNFHISEFVFCIFVLCNFSNSPFQKAQGKCHFERGSPYVWSILDRILKSIGKCHYHKHKHQPAKYQQKWDTKSKCFFVAAMNLTWAEFLFWQLFKKLKWTQKPRCHTRK